MAVGATAIEEEQSKRAGATAAKAASRGALWLEWACASAIIAGSEWILLLTKSHVPLGGQGTAARMLALTFGNWLLYTLAAVVGFRLLEWGASCLQRYMAARLARLAMSSAAGFVALPYALGLGRYTFSGPQARAMAHHSLRVAGTALVVAVVFALVAWLSGLLLPKLWQRLAWAALLAAGVFVVLALSRATMPSEYEPLHRFLAIVALAAASLSGATLGRERSSGWQQELLCAGALGALSVVCGVRLARSEDDSWLLWSQSAGSRYLTERWSFAAEEVAEATQGAPLVARPNLETEQTAVWRQHRAQGLAPNIVIFSIDGLLPSRVGAYGYKARPTTPNIDRMARQGVRFTRAFSTYPATKQFNSSLLLGRLVPERGAAQAPESFRELAITRLLDERGYHSMVQSWFEPSRRKSFDPKYFRIDTNIAKSTDKSVLELPMAERMVPVEQHLKEAAAKSEPVFLWMHLLSTHPVAGDFVPHPRFAWGDSRSERYDSAVAGTDLWLPELEKLMARHADAARATIWIICSDHGVRVDDPGRDLNGSIVRVPLIVVGPGFEPRTVEGPVETSVDLAASVVDLAGIAPPTSYDGISLVPLLMRGDIGSRLDQRVIPLLRGEEWRGAVQGPFKLLRYKRSYSFFDSRSDPNEEHNLYTEQKPRAQKIWKAAQTELERRLAAFNDQSVEVAVEQTETDPDD